MPMPVAQGTRSQQSSVEEPRPRRQGFGGWGAAAETHDAENMMQSKRHRGSSTTSSSPTAAPSSAAQQAIAAMQTRNIRGSSPPQQSSHAADHTTGPNTQNKGKQKGLQARDERMEVEQTELQQLPGAAVLGGMATAIVWAARREETGSTKRVAMSPEDKVAVGSTCAWKFLTAAEAKTRGEAESKERQRLVRQLAAEEAKVATLKAQGELDRAELQQLRLFKWETQQAAKERVKESKRKKIGPPAETFLRARELCLQHKLRCAATYSYPVCVGGHGHVPLARATLPESFARHSFPHLLNHHFHTTMCISPRPTPALVCAATFVAILPRQSLTASWMSPPSVPPSRLTRRATSSRPTQPHTVSAASPRLASSPWRLHPGELPLCAQTDAQSRGCRELIRGSPGCSAQAAIDYFGGSNDDPSLRGPPMPSVQRIGEWRKKAINDGAARPVDGGFKRSNARRFLRLLLKHIKSRPELKVLRCTSDHHHHLPTHTHPPTLTHTRPPYTSACAPPTPSLLVYTGHSGRTKALSAGFPLGFY